MQQAARHARMLPQSQRSTTSAEIDDDTDVHHARTWRHDTGQREGLFTELQSAMDAASAHLLAAEAIVDTSPYDTSDFDRVCDVDRMVSSSILLLKNTPSKSVRNVWLSVR